MSSTEVATRDEAEIAAIAAQQDADLGDEEIRVPLLKIGQKLTKEVDEGDAEEGEFINTLLGEGVGTKIDFIIVDHHKGRAYQDKKANRYFVSDDFDTIPASWSEANGFGPEWVGSPFAEHPDADEMFRDAVNNGSREWGQGAPVKTQHVFTGYALVSPVVEEGEEAEVEYQPVRLPIKITNRDNKNTVAQITQIKRIKLRNKPFWANLFNLSTVRKTFGGGSAYVVQAKLGRETTEEEREMAMALYTDVQAGRVVEAGDATEPTVAPSTKGGLGV